MARESNALVQKLWNYCNLLKDDGLSYGDYVEQLTFLLFLKMSYEQQQINPSKKSPIPKDCNWESLLNTDESELEQKYSQILSELGSKKGMLGLIFKKALNKIQDPAKLRRLIVDLINREKWMGLTADVKGDAYEGLLEKNAQDTKSGAGQYFTPRPVIDAVVDCIRPKPGETVCDPACGTGGFLLAAHDFIADSTNYQLNKEQKKFLKFNALHGVELVNSVARLCAMNLMLHGIGPVTEEEGKPNIEVTDSLAAKPADEYDIVLTNPPFGKKSSVTVIGDEDLEEDENGNKQNGKKKQSLTVVREDFSATTSNKQLNFVQHVKSILKINGRAAVVVPDNVLFEGGAGETIRRKLLDECDVHTLLRLPTGIFYAQGVKANVLFFDRKGPSEKPWTKELWIYDWRTNVQYTLKTNKIIRKHLDEFVECYNPKNRHKRVATWSDENLVGRWRSYSYKQLMQRDKLSFDIFWLKDESLEGSENLPAPDILTAEIIEDLRAALSQFEEIQIAFARG